MAGQRDLSELIERLEAFETRNVVRLEGLYAKIEDLDPELYMEVYGEVHATDGTEIATDLEIVISAHDTLGRVVATSSAYLSADTFFAFDVFSTSFQVPQSDIVKVRVYPKPS